MERITALTSVSAFAAAFRESNGSRQFLVEDRHKRRRKHHEYPDKTPVGPGCLQRPVFDTCRCAASAHPYEATDGECDVPRVRRQPLAWTKLTMPLLVIGGEKPLGEFLGKQVAEVSRARPSMASWWITLSLNPRG